MNNALKLIGLVLAIIGSAFSITLCGVGIGFYLVGLILELTFDKTAAHPRYPEGKFVLPLFISLTISLFISQYFKVSLRGLWKFAEGFILLYAFVDVVRTPKELRIVLTALISTFFLAGLAGISQNILGYDFIYFRQAMHETTTLPPRITGAFKHYNDYGAFLVPGFSITLALFLVKFSNKKMVPAVFLTLLFFILSYTITHTLSRSALLAAFASLFFFSIFFRCRWFAAAGLAVLLLIVWTFPSALSTRFKNIFVESTPERVLLIKTTFSMIKAHPIFGLGLNTYSDYFSHFRPVNYPAIMYAHNSYLQMTAEIGIVGIGFYLAFIFALVIKAVKSVLLCHVWAYKVLTAGCVAAIFGMMTNALFESLLQSTQLRTIFWCLLGISTTLATHFSSNISNNSYIKESL